MTAYQLVFLERVPAFAAVNDAVSLAAQRRARRRRVHQRGAARLRKGAARASGSRRRRGNPIDALATRCAFPTWLAARWVARYGAPEAEALMRAMNERAAAHPPRQHPPALRDEALAARLAAEDDVGHAATPLAPRGS